MKLVYASAALLALVGLAQLYEKGAPRASAVDFHKSPMSFSDAQLVDRPTPRARLQKLLWIPTFDYREFTERVIRT